MKQLKVSLHRCVITKLFNLLIEIYANNTELYNNACLMQCFDGFLCHGTRFHCKILRDQKSRNLKALFKVRREVLKVIPFHKTFQQSKSFTFRFLLDLRIFMSFLFKH
ncbi:CLUMA_CG001801, isoform A [Clunio marinus]|uniref:CLUMA_CG001801, isoform A n=1 Tax=Clunio marinus TaxID=568069 RepID=A0A1J1HIZ8_9DIPT|nr:CLUMA_CG001801, isoform A [Clunio marinus]